MSENHAALVEVQAEAPRYRAVPEPAAELGQEVVEMLAVGIHHVTRGTASGRHYVQRELPIVPGVDGVARRADGSLALVVDPERGTMVQRLAVDSRTLIPIPDADPALLAASLNPVISAWMPLRSRIDVAGKSVLVLGATGASGSMAVRVARHLGASRVVAAGRDASRLDALGPVVDETVRLGEERTAAALAEAAADVDIVLDYLWGPVTEAALGAILRARADDTQLLDWVQIGSMAGADITLPARALRAKSLRLSGSGFGSVPSETYLREVPDAAAAIAAGICVVQPHRVALEDIEGGWAHVDEPGERTVIML